MFDVKLKIRFIKGQYDPALQNFVIAQMYKSSTETQMYKSSIETQMYKSSIDVIYMVKGYKTFLYPRSLQPRKKFELTKKRAKLVQKNLWIKDMTQFREGDSRKEHAMNVALN